MYKAKDKHFSRGRARNVDPTAPVSAVARSVAGHDTPGLGDEPTLETHFFKRIQPLLDRILGGG